MVLSTNSSEVLKELVITMKTLTKSSKIDLLIGEMNLAIQKLQDSLNSLPNSFIGPTVSTLQAPNLFSIYQYSYQQSHCTKTPPFDTYIGQPFDELLSH